MNNDAIHKPIARWVSGAGMNDSANSNTKVNRRPIRFTILDTVPRNVRKDFIHCRMPIQRADDLSPCVFANHKNRLTSGSSRHLAAVGLVLEIIRCLPLPNAAYP